MVAQVHRGERIVPAADNAALLNAVNGGGSAGMVEALRGELRTIREEMAAMRQLWLSWATTHLDHARRAADSLQTMEVVGVQTIPAT
jgi:hypothetical protein